jgi:hypothetical protein
MISANIDIAGAPLSSQVTNFAKNVVAVFEMSTI